jgi:AraC-like DNA-binding protein
MTAFSLRNYVSLQEKTLKKIVIVYFVTTILSWTSFFCYFFTPVAFVYLNVLFFAGVMLVPVFFFRIVRFLTRIDEKEAFSPVHYLLPGLLCATLLVWSLFVPFDTQLAIVTGRGSSLSGQYETFSRLFASKPFFRTAFIAFYYSYIVVLLVRYFRKANDKDSVVVRPAKWILFLLSLTLASALSTVIIIILPRDSIFASGNAVLTSLLTSGEFIVLTSHIIRRKYMIYTVYPIEEREADAKAALSTRQTDAATPETAAVSPVPVVTTPKSATATPSNKLTRRRINAYFREHKPYLQPDYKLSRLARAMKKNRSDTSEFINKTYGVNFNRFINQWRISEMQRLRKLKANKNKSVVQLCAIAGFSDARQYYRALAIEGRDDK